MADNDSVRAYLSQVDNEYDAVRAAAARQFEAMWEKGNPTQASVKNYAEWRNHHAAWKSWLWEVKDDLWLSADDYNTAREWHRQLGDWRAKLGTFTADVPSTKIPERENTTAEDVRETAAAASTPLAIVAGAALLGFFLWRKK